MPIFLVSLLSVVLIGAIAYLIVRIAKRRGKRT